MDSTWPQVLPFLHHSEWPLEETSQKRWEKRQCSVRKKRGINKQSFVEYPLYQALHTYNILVIIPSPWTTTLIFTRGKMEARMMEGWMSNLLKSISAIRSTAGIFPQISLLPKYMFFVHTHTHLFLMQPFLVGCVPCGIMEILDLGYWMNFSWRWASQISNSKDGLFQVNKEILFFFFFRILILLQLVISSSLHRYLVSVPWQWKEGRKFCFIRVTEVCYPKCGCWTSSLAIIWLVRCLL